MKYVTEDGCLAFVNRQYPAVLRRALYVSEDIRYVLAGVLIPRIQISPVHAAGRPVRMDERTTIRLSRRLRGAGGIPVTDRCTCVLVA